MDAQERGLGLLEAVEMMLEHDPRVAQVEGRLLTSRGSLLSASSRFETVVTGGVTEVEETLPESEETATRSSALVSSLGASKQFRSGLTITPDLSLVRDDAPGRGAINQGSLTLTLRQPLLRDRGRATVAAVETAASELVQASTRELHHTISARVLEVLARYWSYRAAFLNLEILAASEQRSRDLMATTERLIEADITPAAERILLQADVAAKEAQRINGERALFAARQVLGREIGLTGPEILALPLPLDPFPQIAPEAAPSMQTAAAYVAEALAQRSDLAAAHQRLSSTRVLERAAEKRLLPRLDLVVAPSVTGLVEGTEAETYFSPLISNVPGVSTVVRFDVSWPPANQLLRGELMERRGIREQNEAAVEVVEVAIGADVPAALDALRRSAERLVKARQAVELFGLAVNNEERKLRAGLSTLIDVVSQQDRLTAARLAEVAANLDLALAIGQLRFQTATLVAPGSRPVVEWSRLASPPDLGGVS